MEELKGALAVLFNFPLQSFSLYITFKSWIAAASEPIPSEKGRFGEWTMKFWCQTKHDIPNSATMHNVQGKTQNVL